MLIRKFTNIFVWNLFEFNIYILFGIIITILLYFLDIGIGNRLTVTGILFTVFMGILSVRFFDKLKELDNLLSTLKMIRELLFVWTKGIKTLSGKGWGGQLEWLEKQKENRNSYKKRILMPHKFQDIDINLIDRIPIKIGNLNLKLLRNSLISINHKINHLNFIIEIIYFREKINDIEVNKLGKKRTSIEEIKSLVFSKDNQTSILSVLPVELHETIRRIDRIICKIEG